MPCNLHVVRGRPRVCVNETDCRNDSWGPRVWWHDEGFWRAGLARSGRGRGRSACGICHQRYPPCSSPEPPSMGYFRSVASCMLLHHLSRTRSPDPGTHGVDDRGEVSLASVEVCFAGVFCLIFRVFFFGCSTGCNCHACVTLCCSCCFGCCSAING